MERLIHSKDWCILLVLSQSYLTPFSIQLSTTMTNPPSRCLFKNSRQIKRYTPTTQRWENIIRWPRHLRWRRKRMIRKTLTHHTRGIWWQLSISSTNNPTKSNYPYHIPGDHITPGKYYSTFFISLTIRCVCCVCHVCVFVSVSPLSSPPCLPVLKRLSERGRERHRHPFFIFGLCKKERRERLVGRRSTKEAVISFVPFPFSHLLKSTNHHLWDNTHLSSLVF